MGDIMAGKKGALGFTIVSCRSSKFIPRVEPFAKQIAFCSVLQRSQSSRLVQKAMATHWTNLQTQIRTANKSWELIATSWQRLAINFNTDIRLLWKHVLSIIHTFKTFYFQSFIILHLNHLTHSQFIISRLSITEASK